MTTAHIATLYVSETAWERMAEVKEGGDQDWSAIADLCLAAAQMLRWHAIAEMHPPGKNSGAAKHWQRTRDEMLHEMAESLLAVYERLPGSAAP